jgi:hypothetical protein
MTKLSPLAIVGISVGSFVVVYLLSLGGKKVIKHTFDVEAKTLFRVLTTAVPLKTKKNVQGSSSKSISNNSAKNGSNASSKGGSNKGKRKTHKKRK